jgi:hypothetical protein
MEKKTLLATAAVLAAAAAAVAAVALVPAATLAPANEGLGAAPGAPPAKPLAVDLRHDVATGETVKCTFDVPEGADVARFAVGFAPWRGSPLCAGSEGRIVVVDPSGATFKDLRVGSVTVGTVDRCSWDEQEGVPLAAGTWTVEFSGRALAMGVVLAKG